VPTLRLRRALENAPAGARIRLLADDPLARVDVPHFAAQSGCELLESGEAEGGGLSFLVARPGA
jgi:tRNA 2-thiouridine synthesizing protein A